MTRRAGLAIAVVAVAAACGARSPLEGSDVTTRITPSVPCVPGNFELRRATPTLMVVVDRSRSMLATFGDMGRTRYDVLVDALSNALPPLDDSIEIGALLFPTPGGSGTNNCVVAGPADLRPKTRQVEPLLSLLRANPPPGGSTPTADAVAAAARALGRVRTAGSSRALVLCTDGAPDCNLELDPATCTCVGGMASCAVTRCLDDTRTVTRIAEAAADGIPTYVVGIQDGDGSSLPAVLDAMADAGQRPLQNQAHRYYAASSPAELDAALVAIGEQVGTCTFLTQSVPDPAGTFRLRVNGRGLELDPSGMIGWHWADRANGELVLSPSACADVHAGARVLAELSCGSAMPGP